MRYFVAVADEENFHRAAARLHVSQSSLSRQVQDLGAEMDVELFRSAGRGVKLTAAGERFAVKARALLAGVEAAVDEARSIARGQLGTVSIGFETGAILTGGGLASIVTAFRDRAPRVALELHPMSGVELWDALRAGKIGFAYGSHAPTDDALAHLVIAEDRLGVVLSRKHRLARRVQLRLRDLASEAVLLQPRPLYPRLHDDILVAARRHGVMLDVKSGALDGEALLAQVILRDAVSFLGERSSLVLQRTSVVWRPVLDLGLSEVQVAAWRRQDADTAVVRSLVECAHDVRRSLCAGSPRGAPGRRVKRPHRAE